MKKLFSKAIMILLSITLLAACATAQTTTSGGTTTAAQLAAALNAMNSGSARVSGNTVTLTGGINAQRDIAVPAGVTLDLTGLPDNNSLNLRDNITLTVNGMVNAPNGKIGFDDNTNARYATINGNGTINLTGKGSFYIDNGKKLTLDGVTLVGIADNYNSLVFVNEGGELVFLSGAITGNTTSHDGGECG
jgi:hypothetical protein